MFKQMLMVLGLTGIVTGSVSSLAADSGGRDMLAGSDLASVSAPANTYVVFGPYATKEIAKEVAEQENARLGGVDYGVNYADDYNGRGPGWYATVEIPNPQG